MKLFWNEGSNVKGGKLESCSRIKDGKEIWKEYFEDLYNLDIQEQVAVHMCSFDRNWRGNYFGGEPIGRAEVDVRVGKLNKGKAAGKDEITGEKIKGRGDRVVDWIWGLCNMAFESGVVPEVLRNSLSK